jgi:hypothetical protein
MSPVLRHRSSDENTEMEINLAFIYKKNYCGASVVCLRKYAAIAFGIIGIVSVHL